MAVSSSANYFAIWEVAAGSSGHLMQMRPRAVLTKYSPALSANIDFDIDIDEQLIFILILILTSC